MNDTNTGKGGSRRWFFRVISGVAAMGVFAWLLRRSRWFGGPTVEELPRAEKNPTFERMIVVTDCLKGAVRTLRIDDTARLAIAAPLLKGILDEWCEKRSQVDEVVARFPHGPDGEALQQFVESCLTEPTMPPTPAGGLLLSQSKTPIFGNVPTFENMIVVTDCPKGAVRTLRIDDTASLAIAAPLLKGILDEWCVNRSQVDEVAARFPQGPDGRALQQFVESCWLRPTMPLTPAGGLLNVAGS